MNAVEYVILSAIGAAAMASLVIAFAAERGW